MTSLEAILLFCLAVSAVSNVLQARAGEHADRERAYIAGLYADAIARLEQTERELRYYKRELAEWWDAAASAAKTRHVGAGE